MAYDLQTQVGLLVGDVRGLFWSTSQMTRTQKRVQRQRAQHSFSLQKREVLTVTAGNPTVALSGDHVQTYALIRGVFSVAVRVVDPIGGVWWLSVSPAGVLQWSTSAPFGGTLLTTALISWLRMSSADATLWYISPSELGETVSATVQPAGSGETGTLQLRDTAGIAWYPTVTDTGIVGVSTSGSATVMAAAIEVFPLQRQDPEGRQRMDAALTVTGVPASFAIEGKSLVLDPTPGASYELEHLYYTTDTDQVTAPWHTVGVLETAAQLLESTQGLAVARQLQALAAQEAELLQAIYVPGDRDARESLGSPAR